MTGRVAVFGARGFVGSAVCRELASAGWEVTPLRAPRPGGLLGHRAEMIDRLAQAMNEVDAVVNAAGLANPTSRNLRELTQANAVVPGMVAEACVLSGVGRLVHVSSAVVQGDLCPLDETTHYRPESPYARTKMRGEQVLLVPPAQDRPVRTVVLRPTSVHGPGRAITRRALRFARSPLASVMAPGNAPTPQVLVGNVGAAAAFLCRADVMPPPIVIQPWEGWTTTSFLQLLSGRAPLQVPASVGRVALQGAAIACPRGARLAYRRRLELLWSGQAQVAGWLRGAGFVAPYGREQWERLAADVGATTR